ncbi:MAG: hypothetical protein ACXWC9_09670 [Pseudobdellovibrionaceae bacterium]
MKLFYVHEPKDNLALVDFFIDQVLKVEEFDYGDCMREWNRELMFLKRHLRQPSEDVLHKLSEMQGYIQFYPTWDVESTRDQILQDADHLRLALSSGEPLSSTDAHFKNMPRLPVDPLDYKHLT